MKIKIIFLFFLTINLNTNNFYNNLQSISFHSKCTNCDKHEHIDLFGQTIFKLWNFVDLILSSQQNMTYNADPYFQALTDAINAFNILQQIDENKIVSHPEDFKEFRNILNHLIKHQVITQHEPFKLIIQMIFESLEKNCSIIINQNIIHEERAEASIKKICYTDKQS